MRSTGYRAFQHDIDVAAFEEAIGFEPLKQATNKLGETEDIGHCPDPWHLHKNGDTTGKFAINRDKKVWHCFVCGGGNLLSLAMAVRGEDEQDAETWVADFARPVEESNESFLSEIEALLDQHRREQAVLPYYNPHALDKWTDQLVHLDAWLRGRGISDDVAVQARLGYQADARRKAPVGSAGGAGGDYTGPCVYLPHFWGERLLGWQQRWLADDRPRWLQKYTNTSGFPKAETIYNYERIYFAERPVIVVESVPTVLLLWSLGYPAVATFGGSVSDEQMRLLRRCHQGVCLAPDNDEPGRKWTGETLAEQALRQKGKRVERIILGDYLARYVPVKVMEAVGEYDSGNDLGDLLDEGITFTREAIALLYNEATYY